MITYSLSKHTLVSILNSDFCFTSESNFQKNQIDAFVLETKGNSEGQ